MDFASLKKNRTSQLETLTAELNKLNTKTNQQSADDRIWYPAVDKAGNGYAVIRFLPPTEGEDVPFIRIWDHGFKGPGGWYIENSRTSLGPNEKDPVGEYNSKLWNATEDDNSPQRRQARAQKRRLTYISNIIVLKDPANPENEGKVFLFKYGKKIFDKLQEVMHPQFPDEKPLNPFDLWDGANFQVKIRNVEGYRNYDKSQFSESGPLLDDDAKLEKIWKRQHKLKPFLDPSNFKSYDDLKAKLYKVLGIDDVLTDSVVETPAPRKAAPATKQSDDDDLPWSTPKESKKSAVVEDDDESLEFFKTLAGDS
jgi:hypothetical protein